MKKITLGALLLSSVFAVAQNSIQMASPKFQGMKVVPNHKPYVDVNERNRQALQAANFHYIIQYGYARQQYEEVVNNVASSAFTYYAQVLFMDSTVMHSSAAATSNVSDMRAGIVMDPTSPYLDPNQSGTPLITKADAYAIDTIVIGGIYQIRTGVNDTLQVEVCWGDTISTTVWQSASIATPKRRWLTPKLNSSTSHGNKSFLTAPAANRVKLKYVLTPADTLGNNVYYIIDVASRNGGVPINVGAGQIASISYTFIPGQPNNPGDIVYEYASPMDPATQNGFAGYMQGETAATPMGYFYDTNQNFNCNVFYFSTGRYGKYTGGAAFLNSCMYPDADAGYNYEIYATISQKFVGIHENASTALNVYQNSPNPANGSTTVSYELKNNSPVTFELFDVTGKQVTSVSEGTKSSGTHSMLVNTENLQAGVYFYTLTAGESKATRKLTVVK